MSKKWPNMFKIIVIAINILVFSTSGLLAQNSLSAHKDGSIPNHTAFSSIAIKNSHAWFNNWTWTSDEWKDDKQGFILIRSNIDKLAKDGTKLGIFLPVYAKQAKKSPLNAKLVFRWSYAAYLAAVTTGNGDTDGEIKLAGVKEALATVPSPDSYEYSRLRFLVEAHSYGFYQLIGLGKRLLSRSPNDFDVHYYLIKCLYNSDKEIDRQEALTQTERLIQQKPNQPNLYALLGAVNYELWFFNKKPEYADAAIVAYHHYLETAPASKSFRKDAEANILWIQKQKTQQN